MKTLFVNFLNDKSGATAIEYALIALLVSVTIVGGATAIGNSLDTTFTNVSGKLVSS